MLCCHRRSLAFFRVAVDMRALGLSPMTSACSSWHFHTLPSCLAAKVAADNQPDAQMSAHKCSARLKRERKPGQVPVDVLALFDVERIRNFSVVAHVDHGKSTLADRMLEMTGTIAKSAGNAQVLDKLQVERERGITVKAQTASMFYDVRGQTYLLNLIDTPGHVDFNFEVARSLSASDGAILLVDANQGVQAQTIANFWLAFERNLRLIPALNKIDLKDARPDDVAAEMSALFELPVEECCRVSAKFGTGVQELLDAIVERLPPPSGCTRDAPLKAFVFDSWFEVHRGVHAFVLVKSGYIEARQPIMSMHTRQTYEVQEVGVLHPEAVPVQRLYAGQVGYVIAQIRTAKELILGDTFCTPADVDKVEPLMRIRQPKPMVYAGLFPVDVCDYVRLKGALEKLMLNDSSVQLEPTSSAALGQGWRTGFLGLLHMEVFHQRLEQEYDESVIITAPSVPYKVHIRAVDGIRRRYGGKAEIIVTDPRKIPEPLDCEAFEEPIVRATIISPDCYLGKIMQLATKNRGVHESTTYLASNRMVLKFVLPLADVAMHFNDQLKHLTSGYASLDFEDAGFKPVDLVRVNVHLNGKMIEEFSFLSPKADARSNAIEVCQRVVDEVPRHQFDVAVQAKIGGKVICRNDIRAVRKDVAGKGGKFGSYGGDITRMMKLVKRQAESKKRLKMIGKIEVPKEAFLNILQRKR